MAEARPPAPKAAKLDGEARGAESALKETSEEEQQTLEKVVSIQHEIDQLNEKASEEILHVEQKYNKLRQPHYTRRSELISSIPDFWHNTVSLPATLQYRSGKFVTHCQTSGKLQHTKTCQLKLEAYLMVLTQRSDKSEVNSH